MSNLLDLIETILLDAFILVASLPMYLWGMHRSEQRLAARRA